MKFTQEIIRIIRKTSGFFKKLGRDVTPKTLIQQTPTTAGSWSPQVACACDATAFAAAATIRSGSAPNEGR
jgi:hypothetical protein